LNGRLTDEPRGVVQGLPPLAANRMSVVGFQSALARDFLPRARRLCERLGLSYPTQFEAAVRRRLSGLLDASQIAAVEPPTAGRPVRRPGTSYDGIAEWYDDRFAGYGDLSDPLSSSSQLLRLLGPGEGLCLDVACGGGLHHQAVASTGRHPLIGIDLSLDQLEVARRRGVASLALASATDLPFPDQTVPTVVCTYLHTDIDEMAPVLAEVRRVLSPGGRVVYLGVHPCFWGHFVENPLGPGRVVHPGYLETGWVDSPFWRDSAGLRAKVGARHVTVSELVNAFIQAGLRLESLEEPAGRTGHADRIAITATRPWTDRRRSES
jgi:SAM-dependent methyltransferase